MPVEIEKKKKRGRLPGTGRGKLQWFDLKEKYIQRHLAGDYCTIEAFAKEHRINVRTAEYHAAKEEWIKEVQNRLNEQHKAIAKHSQNVLQAIRKSVDFDEVEVRTRHSKLMRGLLALAAKKLVKIADDPDSLTTDQMIDILKYAPAEERRAIGLPDRVQVDVNSGTSPALEQFEQELRDRATLAQALAEIARVVEGEVIGKQVKQLPSPDDKDKEY